MPARVSAACRASRDLRGITLFETIAALAIVSVTSASALAAIGSELRTADRARRAIEAEALATTRLDFMTLLTDQELQSLPDSVKSGTFDAPLDQYGWTTSSTASSSAAGVYDIAITITWPKNQYVIHSAVYRRPPLTTTSR